MSISFCTTLIDRWDNFAKMYQSLMPCLDRGCELVVTDWGSKDLDFSIFRRDHQVTFRFKSLPFCRSDGLNHSADIAKLHTLFFIDADMIVPNNFDDWINKRVKPGWSVHPVCYSLYENKPMGIAEGNGWWRVQGFGMCGYHDRDFYDLGMWNTKFKEWGKEDEDLWIRTQRSGVQTCREKCPGLFHMFHAGDRQKYHSVEES